MRGSDPSLDPDLETRGPYNSADHENYKRRSFRQLDPTIYLNPETAELYDDRILHVELLDTRAIAYGAPVDYAVRATSRKSWNMIMN
jgi:hypothetical protein